MRHIKYVLLGMYDCIFVTIVLFTFPIWIIPVIWYESGKDQCEKKRGLHG